MTGDDHHPGQVLGAAVPVGVAAVRTPHFRPGTRCPAVPRSGRPPRCAGCPPAAPRIRRPLRPPPGPVPSPPGPASEIHSARMPSPLASRAGSTRPAASCEWGRTACPTRRRSRPRPRGCARSGPVGMTGPGSHGRCHPGPAVYRSWPPGCPEPPVAASPQQPPRRECEAYPATPSAGCRSAHPAAGAPAGGSRHGWVGPRPRAGPPGSARSQSRYCFPG